MSAAAIIPAPAPSRTRAEIALSESEIARLIDGLTDAERAQIDAYLRHDCSAKAAAAALGCHRKTVASTWSRYRRVIHRIVADNLKLRPAFSAVAH